MASTTSSPSGFFSSPRGQQRLLWISGGVLVIGIAVFLGVFLSRGSAQAVNSAPLTVSTPPAQKNQTPTKPVETVKPATAALQAARTFLETAVARKNLDSAYGIVGPNIKGGLSRAEWRTGNIPVQFFPATNLKTAELTVKWSHKNQLMLEVGLKGKPGSSVKSLAFYLGVDRIGGKWLVNYFQPRYTLPVKQNPYSN